MEDNRAVRRIAAAEDMDEVLSIARAFYRLHGFEALSYARPSHDTPGRTDMLFRGFPEAWVSSYREGLDRLDPIPTASIMPMSRCCTAWRRRRICGSTSSRRTSWSARASPRAR